MSVEKQRWCEAGVVHRSIPPCSTVSGCVSVPREGVTACTGSQLQRVKNRGNGDPETGLICVCCGYTLLCQKERKMKGLKLRLGRACFPL